MKIEGRTFVVSGGASGLGRACVEDICKAGGYAAILDLSAEYAEEVNQAVGGGKTKFFKTDVTDTESIAAAVQGTVEWIKQTGKEIGGVITAAGTATFAPIIDKDLNPFSLKDLDFILAANLRGTVDLVRQIAPHLARTTPVGPDGERGVVIMVSSSSAFDGQSGQVAYAASKGAIVSLTMPLTRDLSPHGIRVVTVAPSLFDSRMTSFLSDEVITNLKKNMEFPPRPGKPHEFSSLVIQGIENVMMNGTVIRLDGGSRLPPRME
ncbi:hypothetical protein HYFRA_00010989 [Hymenoscyphus fraxineus]|uniref:Ketoreductase domain-containing protein n=1 Tax=Hymenoscyphus fraxineus TaxID=746836 RepID=A0A9N9L031_9HELO|nr:hypothetical protein HYFRA_00010989 [Hymenoscyphus fraxineus]